jgi:hypothetical protein
MMPEHNKTNNSDAIMSEAMKETCCLSFFIELNKAKRKNELILAVANDRSRLVGVRTMLDYCHAVS